MSQRRVPQRVKGDVKLRKITRPRWPLRVFLVGFVGALIAICSWFLGDRALNKDVNRQNTATQTSRSGVGNPDYSPATHAVEMKYGRGVESDAALILDAKNLSYLSNVAEAMRNARRAQDLSTQAFAVYMPVRLCGSLSDARNLGALTIKSNVPSKQIVYDESALSRIALRCQEFEIEKTSLRTALISELKKANAPITAFFSSANLDGDTKVSDETRLQFARAVNESDATALQTLALVWAEKGTGALSKELSPEAKPYSIAITNAAFEIALCRIGAACGKGSIALDMMCTRFAVCDATDVETAYKSVHRAVDLSFSDTDRLATIAFTAIRDRDFKKLGY
jgi:hypothetical protein